MKLTASYVNNRASKNAADFIKESEKRYQDEIYSVAEEIVADENKKIIMLAGPSGSGKTTTAHIRRLCRSTIFIWTRIKCRLVKRANLTMKRYIRLI